MPLAARSAPPVRADLPDSLLAAAQASPDASFRVIVQARPGRHSRDAAGDVTAAITADPGKAKGLKRRFVSIAGVSAQLTGEQILFLAARPGVLAITPDVPLAASGGPTAPATVTLTGVAQVGSALSVETGLGGISVCTSSK